MKVGVVKEIKSDEYRIALTPDGARELVQRGHEVLVEVGAGEGSSFPDDAYESVGASLGDAASIGEEAALLLKVKEPLPSEYPLLRKGLVLFTYLHLAASEELTRALVESGAACVAYETVETDNHALPLLAPMSEIAGRLAAQAGAYFLERPQGGRGLLLGGVPGVAPGQVVVIGGGMGGYNAAAIALGLSANRTIIERSIGRRRHLEAVLGCRATLHYVEEVAEHGLAEAVARDTALAHGVNVLDGKVTYEAVAEAHGLDYAPLEDVLPLSPV